MRVGPLTLFERMGIGTYIIRCRSHCRVGQWLMASWGCNNYLCEILLSPLGLSYKDGNLVKQLISFSRYMLMNPSCLLVTRQSSLASKL